VAVIISFLSIPDLSPVSRVVLVPSNEACVTGWEILDTVNAARGGWGVAATLTDICHHRAGMSLDKNILKSLEVVIHEVGQERHLLRRNEP
jgi:hypothetical protein